MAAGDVSLTRGVTERDDALDVSGYTDTTGSTASGINNAMSTNGDIGTWQVSFLNSGNGTYFRRARTLGTNPSTNTYPKILVRTRKTLGGTNAKPQLEITYTDASTSIFDVAAGSNFGLPETFSLAANKNVQKYGFRWLSQTANLTEAYELEWDFIFVFKETLTLPAVSQPLRFSLPRTLVELPIPSREGGVLQDIGSDSPRLEIAGTLVATTSPNNYTGDQWWDVLVGLWLEGNWQWLGSDRVNYKYHLEELVLPQDPGRVGYYEFKMRLKKVDILSATAQTYGAIQ